MGEVTNRRTGQSVGVGTDAAAAELLAFYRHYGRNTLADDPATSKKDLARVAAFLRHACDGQSGEPITAGRLNTYVTEACLRETGYYGERMKAVQVDTVRAEMTSVGKFLAALTTFDGYRHQVNEVNLLRAAKDHLQQARCK